MMNHQRFRCSEGLLAVLRRDQIECAQFLQIILARILPLLAQKRVLPPRIVYDHLGCTALRFSDLLEEYPVPFDAVQ